MIVLGLTDEFPETVKLWLQQHDVAYYIATDPDGKYRDMIGIEGILFYFIFNIHF